MAVFHHGAVRLRGLRALGAGLFVGFLGCSWLLGLDPLQVTDWRPREARLDSTSVEEVWIEFSAEVDETKTEQAFSLSENGTPMRGRFVWQGRRLAFVPARPISPGNDYEIAVLTSAETKEGNSLAKEFRFAFSTKAETSRPAVVSVQPADGSRVTNQLLPIVVTFSEPVDRASFMAAFSVSPDPGGTITFDSSGSVASFTPLSVWNLGTTYSVVISDAVTDLSGNRLPEPVRLRFTTGAEATRPSLLAARQTVSGAPMGSGLIVEDATDSTLQINAGFEATWGIELQFSTPVLRENIESFIDFEPAWTFQVDPSGLPRDRFQLVPKERFVWGSLYCLTVRKGVSDTSGNASQDDVRFMIRVDGPRTRPPAVELMRFRTNPGDSTATYDEYTPSSAFSNLNLSSFTPGIDTVSYFDVYLRLADGAAVDPFSLMHAFSATATNGAALIAPVAVVVGVFADPQPLAISGLVPARVSVEITNTTSSGVVTLGVSDSLTDTAANKATAAFSLPLLK